MGGCSRNNPLHNGGNRSPRPSHRIGRSHYLGTGAECECGRGTERVENGLLGVPNLSGRFVARSEPPGNRTQLCQELQQLPAERRLVHLCAEQLHADVWQSLHRPEHLAYRRYALAEHFAGLHEATGRHEERTIHVRPHRPDFEPTHLRDKYL